MSWRKINSRIVYKNPWFRIREDSVIRPDGKRGTYGIVERPPVNFIIPLSNKNTIFLIKEYRYPIGRNIIQLPAGTQDNNETPLSAARKELFQETGIRAKKWKRLGGFYIGPGHENIYANIYLATKLDTSDLKKEVRTQNEIISEVMEVPIKKLKKLIKDNKIKCGITLAALNIFFLENKK